MPSVKEYLTSPDFKNIQLGIELNLYSREIIQLADFYRANQGMFMCFYDFTNKISRAFRLSGVVIDATFLDYEDFEIFNERLASIFGIKIYYAGSYCENIIRNKWDTMDRILLGIGITDWIRTRNYSKISYYKENLPF